MQFVIVSRLCSDLQPTLSTHYSLPWLHGKVWKCAFSHAGLPLVYNTLHDGGFAESDSTDFGQLLKTQVFNVC